MSQLLSFIIFFIVSTGIGIVLYLTYLVYLAVIGETQTKLASKNINMARSGAHVGVKLEDEKHRDSAQKYLYRAWNNSSGAALLDSNRWIRKQ